MALNSFQMDVLVGTTPQILLAANPNRRWFLISNNSGAEFYMSLGKKLGAGYGIQISPNERPLEFSAEKMGHGIELEIWITSNTANSSVALWVSQD